MPRAKEFDWVLPVAFTAKQADLIESYAVQREIPYREAVRQIFDIGAETLSSGGRRVDTSAIRTGARR
jgi:hypothetical protein